MTSSSSRLAWLRAFGCATSVSSPCRSSSRSSTLRSDSEPANCWVIEAQLRRPLDRRSDVTTSLRSALFPPKSGFGKWAMLPLLGEIEEEGNRPSNIHLLPNPGTAPFGMLGPWWNGPAATRDAKVTPSLVLHPGNQAVPADSGLFGLVCQRMSKRTVPKSCTGLSRRWLTHSASEMARSSCCPAT